MTLEWSTIHTTRLITSHWYSGGQIAQPTDNVPLRFITLSKTDTIHNSTNHTTRLVTNDWYSGRLFYTPQPTDNLTLCFIPLEWPTILTSYYQ